MGRSREPLPAALVRLQGELDQWRATSSSRQRIPEGLWQRAARCAAQFGVSRTASALRVSYYGLQRRLGAAPKASHRQDEPTQQSAAVAAGPGFVELMPLAIGQCTIEAENSAGDKLRLVVSGHDHRLDATGLVRSLWER